MRLAIALILSAQVCLVAEAAAPAYSQAARIGTEYRPEAPLFTFEGGRSTKPWSKPLADLFGKAERIRLELRVTAKGMGLWSIKVLDDADSALSLSPSDIQGPLPYTAWSTEIRADKRPRLVVEGDYDSLVFEASATIRVTSGGVPQVMVGPDERVEMSKVDDPRLRDFARSVGSLRFIRHSSSAARSGYFGCTATIVGDGILLTASHCTADASRHESLSDARFYFLTEVEPTEGARVLRVKRSLTTQYSNNALDYAFLTLSDSPESAHSLSLTGVAPVCGTQLALIQDSFEGDNSARSIKKVSLKGCECTGEWQSGAFSHRCDTVATSSGGPILRADGVIVGIHVGGIVVRGDGQNHALSMQALAESLSKTPTGRSWMQRVKFVQ